MTPYRKFLPRSFGILLNDNEFQVPIDTPDSYDHPVFVQGTSYQEEGQNGLNLAGWFNRGTEPLNEFDSINDLITKLKWKESLTQIFVNRLQKLHKA